MCKNTQKLEPCYGKKSAGAGVTVMKTKSSGSWSIVHEKKSSGAGAVSFLSRVRSPGFIVDFIPRSFLVTHIDIVILTTKKNFLHRALLFLFMSHKLYFAGKNEWRNS